MESSTKFGADVGALDLFAEWVSRIGNGEHVDFDALLAAHPEAAAELRDLHATWEQMVAAAELSFSADAEPGHAPATDTGGAGIEGLAARGASPARYTREGEVARGGMGAILRVFDEVLRRRLAMKVVLDERPHAPGGALPGRRSRGSAVSPRTLARFLYEAQVTSQLDHPGIVPVHELGLDEERRIYFTMKLVEGRDLKQIFELVFAGKEGWSETRMLGVILKACEAIGYAHKKGVIHRDLKPANVMVGHFGEVYVMDWGLARVLDKKDERDLRIAPRAERSATATAKIPREAGASTIDSPLVTMDGDVMGTPAYMPPEQARGEIEKLSPRSDVYSIGAILYHLLAREMPYVPRGTHAGSRQILDRVLSGPPRALHELNPDVPGELVAICEKAMSRDAEQRYPDTRALAEDLRAFLENRVVAAYETGAVAELKKWVKRNRFLAAACAAAIASLAIGLVVSSFLFVRARTETARADEKATLLGLSNTALAAATKTAEEKAAEAEEQRKVAQNRTDDVLSLSALADLEALVARADALWPAEPRNVAKYEEWLRAARVLVEGRPADPARGIKAKPSLADHRAKRIELEARALPQSSGERAAERASHPRATELEQKQVRLTWMSRMLGELPWPDPTSAQLDPTLAATSASGMNTLAWRKIDPRRTVYGEEALGLALANAALERSSDAERPMLRTTVAWGLYGTGRFDEARDAVRKALDEAPDGQRAEFEGYVRDLERAISRWRSANGRPDAEQERAVLVAETDALAQLVSSRQDWSFESSDDRWWHVQLGKLITDLEAFADPETGLFSAGTSPEHGWGMQKRLGFARTIEEVSVTGEDAESRWRTAITAIRDPAVCPAYAGLAIEPQLGLLPIGRDPASGLYEFAHLASGAAAAREPDGKLALENDTGIVLVLVPGGTSWMGGQPTDPAGRNYDPKSTPAESPVHAVELAPFFLSKYEMTQGQWLRFTGNNPSQYPPGQRFGGLVTTLLDPVEQVSWKTATLVLSRLALDLPTEVQWEYGARAGTSTVWWTGDDVQSIEGAANLADNFRKNHGGPPGMRYEEWLDDGFACHAPVGRYRANAFGVHDVIGNVRELCRDGWGKYDLPVRTGDGSRLGTESRSFIIRGSSFHASAADGRSARRIDVTPEYHDFNIGLRPARALD